MHRFHARAWPMFFALAVVHTWPLARYAGSRVVDFGDGLLNAWLLTASARQLIAHPLTPFDVNMYYPYPYALATLDHQLAAALTVAPAAFATDNALLVANLYTIATFVLAGVFMAMLVARLTGSSAAALLSGCVFAFSAMRVENLNHSHVLGNCWWPLALLAWHHYAAKPTWKRLWQAAAAVLWLALGSWFSAIVGGLAVAIVAAGEWLKADRDRGVVLRRALLPAAAIAIVLGLIAVPYVAVGREYMQQRPRAFDVRGEREAQVIERTVEPDVIRSLAIPVESYLSVAAGTRMPWSARLASLSGAVGARYFPGMIALIFGSIAALAVARWQVRAFPAAWMAVAGAGLLAFAVLSAAFDLPTWPISAVRSIPWFFASWLAIVFVWLFAPKPDQAGDRWISIARIYVVLGVVGLVLSLGDEVKAFGVSLGQGAYPVRIPPFSLIRASSRFGALFSVSAAVLTGYGYALAERRLATPAFRRGAAVLALIVINAELLAAPVKLTHVGQPPDVYEWLRRAPAGPVVDYPIHANLLGLYWSLYHRHPIVNGGGAIEPAPFHRLEESDDLSPEMLAHLRTYWHPRYVVVNDSAYPNERGRVLADNLAANKDELTLVAQFGTRRVFEISGPSRGRVVTRSYPARMLAGKRAIAVEARLEQASNRGAPVLQVWGNGQLLGSKSLERGDGASVVVPLPRDVTGGLDVEVMADYTLAPQDRPELGKSAVRSPSDIALTVSPERTRIEVNGHVWIGEKGYTVVTLNPDGRVAAVHAFNTSWSEDESHALAAHLRSLSPGTIVSVATFFDASRSLTEDAVRELAALGFGGDLRGRFQWAHAGIGVKGGPAGAAIESIGETHAECRVGLPSPIWIAVDDVRID